MDRHAAFDEVKYPNSWQILREHQNLAGRPLKPGVSEHKAMNQKQMKQKKWLDIIIIAYLALFFLLLEFGILFLFLSDEFISQLVIITIPVGIIYFLVTCFDNYRQAKKNEKTDVEADPVLAVVYPMAIVVMLMFYYLLFKF